MYAHTTLGDSFAALPLSACLDAASVLGQHTRRICAGECVDGGVTLQVLRALVRWYSMIVMPVFMGWFWLAVGNALEIYAVAGVLAVMCQVRHATLLIIQHP